MMPELRQTRFRPQHIGRQWRYPTWDFFLSVMNTQGSLSTLSAVQPYTTVIGGHRTQRADALRDAVAGASVLPPTWRCPWAWPRWSDCPWSL